MLKGVTEAGMEEEYTVTRGRTKKSNNCVDKYETQCHCILGLYLLFCFLIDLKADAWITQ